MSNQNAEPNASVDAVVRRFELRHSQFAHPDQKSGQHVNGPASLFIREDDSCHWYHVEDVRSKSVARRMIEQMGLDKFLSSKCSRLVD